VPFVFRLCKQKGHKDRERFESDKYPAKKGDGVAAVPRFVGCLASSTNSLRCKPRA